jgi:two-component system phosphate regulon response regulator PhoB
MPTKILIIDDDLQGLKLVGLMLQRRGYTIVVARGGVQGLAKAESDAPDLIILDIMMPGDGGVVMYSRLKSEAAYAEIPVIMISAVAAPSFRHFLAMLNAQRSQPVPEPVAYLEKPVDHDQLLQLVQDTIG